MAEPGLAIRLARLLLVLAAIVLSIGAGAAKVMEAPLEVQAFRAAGLAAEILSLYGAVQIVCALLLLFRRTRVAAGVVLAAIFAMSAWLLFPAGATGHAVYSAAMAALCLAAVLWRPARRAPR